MTHTRMQASRWIIALCVLALATMAGAAQPSLDRLIDAGRVAMRQGADATMKIAAPRDGALRFEDEALDTTEGFRLRLQVNPASDRDGIGVALTDGVRWYRAGFAGGESVFSGGASRIDDNVVKAGFSPVAGQWTSIELEGRRVGQTVTWQLFAWREDEQRPAQPLLVAVERDPGFPVSMRAGVWAEGRVQARNLEVFELSTKGSLQGVDGWPINLAGEDFVFAIEEIAKSLPVLSMERIDAAVGERMIVRAPKLATSFPCNPYKYHFEGYAPGDPTSSAMLHLPPVDNDCDGAFNEDGYNGHDDDGDGLIDEDPRWCADALLNWSSVDQTLDTFDTGDAGAAILVYRSFWTGRTYMAFAAYPGSGRWLTGGVRISPLGGGLATIWQGWAHVDYVLSPSTSTELEVLIKENGVALDDGAVFNRAVALTAATSGGSGVITTTATIDGQPYTLGVTFAVEGQHQITVEASDTSGGSVSATRSFTIDLTAPLFSDLDPLSGTVVPSQPITVSGQISADAESVAVNGIAATLQAPVGDWRAFSAVSVPLGEGLNTLSLAALDAAGNSASASLVVELDTLAPVVSIESPLDGTLYQQGPVSVTGSIDEAHLASLTVNGAPATVSGQVFTASLNLGEGEHSIVAMATDDFGRTGSDEITVIIDSTAPDVVIDAPLDGSVFTASPILVSGHVEDPYLSSVSVNSLPAQINGTLFTSAEVPLTEGQNLIAATALDQAGNSATTPAITVYLDTQAPVITIDDLPELIAVQQISISGTVNDPHLDRVEIGSRIAVVTGTQWVVADFELDEGDNTIVATAHDAYGHSASTVQQTVTIDTLAPVVEITAPSNGQDITELPVMVTGTVSDPHLDPASLVVAGQPVTVTGGSFSIALDLDQGENTLVVTASDTLGHTASSAPVTVVVDTLAPVVTLTDPMVSLVSTPSVAIQGHAYDAHLDAVVVGTVPAVLSGDSFVADPYPLQEGLNTITATATDTFGHEGVSNEIVYTLDTTPPAISIASPADGDLVAGTLVTVTGTVADEHLDEVTVNGILAAVANGSFSASDVPVDPATGVITATAVDGVGLSASASVVVVFDALPPVVTITAPGAECLQGGSSYAIGGTYADDNPAPSGSAVVLQFTDSNGVSTQHQGLLSMDGTWSVPAIPFGSVDGTAVASVVAVDAYGNSTPANHNWRVDISQPVVQLLMDGAPFPGAISGSTPPSQPTLIGQALSAAAQVTDAPFNDPLEANLTLDGIAYAAGAVIDAEGEHVLAAEASDCAGLSGAASARFLIDLTPPTVTILESGIAMTDGLLLGRAAVFTVQTDDVTETSIEATIDGVAYTPGTLFGESGDHSLVVTVTDAVNLSTTETRSFTIDVTPPEVIISQPTPGQLTQDMAMTVAGTVTDDAESVVVDGTPAILDAPTGGVRAFSAAAVPLDFEGENALVVVATDAAGNSAQTEITVIRDTQAPVITISSPEADAITRLADLMVAGQAQDGHLDTVSVNGAPAIFDGDGLFTHPLVLNEGLNTITVIATDGLGQQATQSRNVTLDSEPPMISVTAGGAPLSDGLLTNQALTPVVEINDATAVSSTITLNGAPFVSGTPIAEEGSYLLIVSASDEAGNSAQREIAFSIDLSPPVLSSVSPVDGSVLSNATPNLSGAADDAVNVTVNGTPASLVASNFNFSALSLSEGANPIAIVAVDEAGNQATLDITLHLDTVLPVLEISEPGNGELLGEAEVRVSGQVSDDYLEGVTIQGAEAALAGGSFSKVVPVSSEGVNTITIIARDQAGNSETVTVSVERDSEAPAITISEPGPGAVFSEQSFTVSGTVSDSHLETVLVNGQSAAVDAGGAFSHTLTLAEGRHTITVEASDSLGNSATLERDIRIDLEAPELQIDSPQPDAILDAPIVTVSGSVSEPEQIATLTVNGESVPIPPDGVFTTDIELPEGESVLIVRAIDEAGNSGVVSITVEVDTVGPEIISTVPVDGASDVPTSVQLGVSFSEPMDAATLAAAITLSANGNPVDISVTPVDGARRANIVTTGGLVSDAEHQLTISTAAADRAGHALAASTTVTFSTTDSTPPTAPQITPLISPACFSTLAITGTAEPGVGIQASGSVQSASTVADGASGAFALDLIPTVSEGAVTVSLVAIDGAGNTSDAAPATVELDCELPTVIRADWDGNAEIRIRFSEAVDPATVIAGASLSVDDVNGPLGFVHGFENLDLVVTLDSIPDPAVLPLELQVTDGVTDRAGNPVVPYTRLLADPATATLVAGEVFDDRNSLELSSATVELVYDGVALPEGSVVITADGRGRFQLPVTSSPVTVRIEAEGFLPSWRRVVPVPGASTLLFDARLSARAEAVHFDAAGQLSAGEIELTVDASSLPAGGLGISLSPVSEQGLPDLLPLGWRPVMAANLDLGGNGPLLAPSVLQFTGDLPADAVIARYDANANVWIAEAFGSTLDVEQAGTWALLAPDSTPNAPGTPVLGSALPESDSVDPGVLSATLALDPDIILPMELAEARVEVTPTTQPPSGLAVEALLDEVLHIVDGRVVVAPPSAVDLVLYGAEAGLMQAEFGLGASETARQLALDEGTKTVHIRALPAGVRTEDLIGPAGGTILTTDGLGLEVPAGALDRIIGIELKSRSLDVLPLAMPDGLEAVLAANLDIGETMLAAPAVLSYPGEGQADTQYMILSPVEVDGATNWRFVGTAALDSDRIVCDPANAADLPAPWVTNSGLYVLARPTADAWGLVSGLVLDVDGAPATTACTISATGGLVQLNAIDDGSYATAAPAGIVDLAAVEPDMLNVGVVQTTLTAGVHLPDIDIPIQITGPSIVATSPLDGAAEVSATTPIAVDFSEQLNPASIGPDAIVVRVIVGTSPAQVWAGQLTLASDATRLTWEPDSPFPPASQVIVTVSAALVDLQGYGLEGGAQNFGFGVERFLLPDDIDQTKIRLYMPGRDPALPEYSICEGEPGAVPSDVYLWIENLDHLNTVEVKAAGMNGDFRFDLEPFDGHDGYVVGDRLLLHILASAEPDDELAVLPLTPWQSVDGMGAFFSMDGAFFETVEGVVIDVPFGAFETGGSVHAAMADFNDLLDEWTEFTIPRTAVELEIGDGLRRRLNLVIPGDAPTDPTKNFLVARILDVAGTPTPMLMATASWNADLGAYVTTVIDDQTPAKSDEDALAKAAASGVPDGILPGVIVSASYVVFETMTPPGGKADFDDGIEDRILVDTPEGVEGSNLEVRKVFLSEDGSIGYVNTIFYPIGGVLLMYPDVGPGAWASANLGIIQALTTSGATIPLYPDWSFRLQVVDGDTGYIHSEQGYPAPTDGWVDIDPSDAPGMANTMLEITGGDPFTIFNFDISTGDYPLATNIDASKTGVDSQLQVKIGAGALAEGTRVRLYNMTTGGVAEATTISGMTTLSLSGDDASIGDPALFVIEPQVSGGSEKISLIFNKVIDRYDWYGSVGVVIDEGSDGTSPSLDLDPDGQVLFIEPDPAWEAGVKYSLEVRPYMFSDSRLGSGQNLSSSIKLPFKVAEPALGQPVLPDNILSDVAYTGDLLILGDRDAGLKIYDYSDPGASSHPEVAYTDGIVGVGAVETDGFGHILALEGKVAQHVALRMYRIDDFINSPSRIQIGVAAVLPLSAPYTWVGPGDLAIEVFAETVKFNPHPDEDHGFLTIGYETDANGEVSEWTDITVPENLMRPYHPVILEDGFTGRIYTRETAPASGVLTIDNEWNVPLNRPLILRAHSDTIAYASSAGGAIVSAALDISHDGTNLTYDFTITDSLQNSDLLNWFIDEEPPACRELNSVDLVYLGRHAVSPRIDGKALLLSASRYEGLWSFKQWGALPMVQPDSIRCLRSDVHGERLSDVAAARWHFGDDEDYQPEYDDFGLAAIAGHHQLMLYKVNPGLSGADGLSSSPVAPVEDLGWNPFRLALDPLNRMILVRDNAKNLKIFSLEDAGELETVADITLDNHVGFGPLLVDPDLGFAVAGNSPIQYIHPKLEIVADADGDAVYEQVEFLQPLGAPMPDPVIGNDGSEVYPPMLAYVRTRIVGVPDGTDSIKVKVEGLGPGGAPLPLRPKPFLPTSTMIELKREADLDLDDPGRHTFISTRPLLLIADERARTERWQEIEQDNELKTKLTDEDTARGEYALCRNCDRDVDDDDQTDILWGEPAPHPGESSTLDPGSAPIEMASAGRLRFSLQEIDSSSGWLSKLEEEGLLPTAEVASLPWEPSPMINLSQNLPVTTPAAPQVDLDSGALMLNRRGPHLMAPGMDPALPRAYLSGESNYGLHGWGWGIAGVDRLRPNPDGTVDLVTDVGRRYVFAQGATAQSASDPNVLTAVGHPGELKKKSNGWFILYPDGSYTEYNDSGYPTVRRDRMRMSEDTGSEIRFIWSPDGTLARVSNANGTRSEETKPRAFNIEYKQGDQYSTGLIETIKDSANREWEFDYDNYGRMTSARGPQARMKVGGGTEQVTETITLENTGSIEVAQMESATQIDTITGGSSDPLIDVDWVDDKVQKITRGQGSDSVFVDIDRRSDHEWVLTEGGAGENPTTTNVKVVEVSDRWQQTITLGPGQYSLQSFVEVDRDGRIHKQTDPRGTKTSTYYNLGAKRRLSFAPQTVITEPGSIGESRPETPSMLTSSYVYYPGTTLPQLISRPGPNGTLSTSYGKDGDSYPYSITGPDGRTTYYHRDDLGRTTMIMDSTGSTTTLEYDDPTGQMIHGSGEPVLSRRTSSEGFSNTRMQRDEQGFVTATNTSGSDPQQPTQTTTYDVNKIGWTLETNTGSTVTRTDYDADGRITQIQSGGANVDGFYELSTTVPGYTSAGMIESITRSHGEESESSSMTYDHAGRLKTSTTGHLTTTYEYDTAGRIQTRTESGFAKSTPRVTIYDYDTAGALEYTTTPGGKVWRNVYDTLGRQVGRIDPAGVREDMTMTAGGQLASRQLTYNDTVWSWEEYGYDAAGRMHTRTVHRFPLPPTGEPADDQLLTTTTNYYDDDSEDPRYGLVRSIEDPLGRVTEFDYDDAGREKLRILPDGTEVVTDYYPDGKVYQRTVRYTDQADPARSWELTTTTTYDEQGRVHTVTAPGGQMTTTLYDELGRKESETTTDSVPDENGDEVTVDRLTFWDYGDLGRVVTTTRPDGATITRSYDEQGNLISYKDTDNNETEYVYDDFGRLEEIYYPGDAEGSPSRSFTYTLDGEVDTITRKDGALVDFVYELDTGRLDTITVTGGVQPGGVVNFDYNAVGHLMAAFDNQVSLGFTWDSLGNQLSESLSVPGVLGSFPTKQINRVFDAGNRAAIIGLPDGAPYLQRLYDAGGRLSGLYLHNTQPQPGDPSGGQQLWAGAYAGSRLEQVTRGNGLLTEYHYDGQGRPIDVVTGIPGGGGEIADPIHQLGLSWTEASLRRSKTRQDLNSVVEKFHYDEVGHLESNVNQGIPAVAGADADLAAATGLDPRDLEEWWTVNRVDELSNRDRVLEGRLEDPTRLHNALHQVEQAGAMHYDWDVNGNLGQSSREISGGTLVTDSIYTHDWRDRLVAVERGAANTDLIIDPLGRLVAKVTDTGSGEVNRVYLHDGDQVVAEYVQEAGGSNYQLERRHHWGSWIDQLVAEEVDTDHNGTLDTTLYPVTDLLGSVQVLTDETGEVVERIEYDADGTPHFFSADTTPPMVTRVAWTGDGARPIGDTVTAEVFEIGFSETIDEASLSSASVTLTPDGGSAIDLNLTLNVGGRSATASGAVPEAGVQYTLNVSGLRDRAGNELADTVPLAIGDPAIYEVADDARPPEILAVLDADDGIYVLLDEPVAPATGFTLADAIGVTRSGAAVTGTTTRISGQFLKWTPGDPDSWIMHGEYTLAATRFEDLSGEPVAANSITFTHLAIGVGDTLVAYAAEGDSAPIGESAYGVKNLFQGREWHSALGLYYYRARWYSPEMLGFLERDPAGYVDGENLYLALRLDPQNLGDPLGEKTDVSFDEGTNTISLEGFIEFFGEDGDYESARAVAESIETGWNKQVRISDGRIIQIEVKINFIYSANGETRRHLNWDQVLLYEGWSSSMSQMNLEDPVTGAPEETLTDRCEYKRSIAGGVSVGRINLNNFEGGWIFDAKYPGNAAHEWGHALGFWYHVGNQRMPSASPSDKKVEEWKRTRPSKLDPMGDCRIRPKDYIPSEKEVRWLIKVAKMQTEENPAYVAGPYPEPPN